MRLAVFGDIHGNSIALDAVLSHIEADGGADGYVVLGDHAAMGPDPVGVLERLVELRGAAFVRGNTDRYVVAGERPTWFKADRDRSDSERRQMETEIDRSLAWTQEVVTAAGWSDWLAALEPIARLTLADGTRLLAAHGSHHSDDDPRLRPNATDDELRTVLADAAAELIFVGHTHRAMDRRLAPRLRVVNPGSVSNPIPPEPDIRAGYVLVKADERGHSIELRRVPYDYEGFATHLRRVRHPAADFLTRRFAEAASGR